MNIGAARIVKQVWWRGMGNRSCEQWKNGKHSQSPAHGTKGKWQRC
jgi:hypothetical protein